jgi:multiple sugar transport system permease protein
LERCAFFGAVYLTSKYTRVCLSASYIGVWLQLRCGEQFKYRREAHRIRERRLTADQRVGLGMGAQHILIAERPMSAKAPWRPPGRRHLHGADFRWTIPFVVPYAAVFLALVVYPYSYALWMASKPSLYAELIADRLYLPTIVNTLLFVGVGVNVEMFLALLLSGFFLRPRWWIRILLAFFILPWALAAAQACVSFHWMLIGEPGLVDAVLSGLVGIDGPNWFTDRWLGLGSDVIAHIWKWMPFWTVIFLVARMRIARDI